MGTTRRTFLRWATVVGSAVSGLLVGGSSLLSFLSPAFRRPQATRWIKLGEVDQFETGVPTRFDFAETVSDAWLESRPLRGVWIYSDDGKAFTVYNGRCTHLGCSYSFVKERSRFECPCHRGMFDLKSGAVLAGPPPRALDTLETKIEKGYLYAAYRDFRGGVADKIAAS
jgi:menaquinol-cytochrome c reductase iron-sulfur subunit